MAGQFTWIDIYQELADVLRTYQDKQGELIAFLEKLREQDYVITSLLDKNRDGERFLLREIDPFTFYGVFNRGIRNDQRISILSQIKNHFQLQSSIPSEFSGVPVLNNMKSWFFPYHANRKDGDIAKLWRVFKLALQEDPLDSKEFLQAFDEALTVANTNINLTMGLFWVRPHMFISLDSRNRDYLKLKIPPRGLTARFYIDTLRDIEKRERSFPEISWAAWESSQTDGGPTNVASIGREGGEEVGVAYWLVGSYWDDMDPPDQTRRFLDEGIWENGYEDRYLEEVKLMKVGDKIAIKSTTTQRNNLPFDAHDHTVSRMDIKARGTVVANRGDGRTIEVEWDTEFHEKQWYFYTYRNTIWRLRRDEDYKHREYSEKLIAFIWGGKAQDLDWFRNRWWGQKGGVLIIDNPPYSVEDVIAAGVFLEEEEIHKILDRLRVKKALILQGSPGVGKTFVARKLAYALMEEEDRNRLEMVQFHQSYSYDDFVRGYRPLPGQAGSFSLQDGVFYKFCKKADQDPDRKHVFIIDEINRGNLSLIFGELLMLIEADKRGQEFAVPLVYHTHGEERFYIPANVYLIGLMNLADRSLAMVDYALRRRFAYETLLPQYESELFRRWLLDRSMQKDLVNLITTRMGALNREIKDDPTLGENYQVGHSYFCPKGDNFAELDRIWYATIINTEIAPLLKEYWFDNAQKAGDAIKQLLNNL